MFVYLFEAKSIQSYLFQSGKLKDVISASERLDRLIDSTNSSVLHHVLTVAKLDTDLLDKNRSNQVNLIRFLRCKGGAFYCYARENDPLLKLRSVWTLTLQQLFPSMEYADALVEGNSLIHALDTAQVLLACDRNTPSMALPIASAVMQSCPRTAKPSVKISEVAKKATYNENDKDNYVIDLDTDLHRQAYQALKMRTSAALQDKFTPEALIGKIHYPLDLDNEFKFNVRNNEITLNQDDPIKDIALIHIDGNGLGIILMALKTALKDEDHNIFREAFRLFSDALNHATIEAAKKATQFIYDKAHYLNSNDKDKLMIPMRPIVLGGDDITLLCRADLALEYSQIFCREFQTSSKIRLCPLFNDFIAKSQHTDAPRVDGEKNNKLPTHLTASGGVLFHKAGHPFTHSYHVVEELCAYAKQMTKSAAHDDNPIGPAALAFHRLSNAVYSDFSEIINRSLRFVFQDKSTTQTFQIGQASYFINASLSTNIPFDFEKLDELVQLSTQYEDEKKRVPVSIARWRQMATFISQGDIDEANRIYYRGRELAELQDVERLNNALQALVPSDAHYESSNWYWTDKKTGIHHTFINDLLIIHNFKSDTHSSVTDYSEEMANV